MNRRAIALGILLRAAEVPDAEKEAFFARECAALGITREELQATESHHPDAPPRRVLAPLPEQTTDEDFAESIIGRIIHTYVLDSLIDRGSSSLVMKAISQLTMEPVAIKILRADLPVEAERLFEKELIALSRLRHQHIVQLRGYGVVPLDPPDNPLGGRRWIALEFVSGTRLTDVLRESVDPVSHACLPSVFLAICRAIGWAHTRYQLGHGDLKPDNILVHHAEPLQASGVSARTWALGKIIDFGLVEVSVPEHLGDSMERPVRGTPAYMAPEQFQGAITPRTDVWSIGAMLFEWATGTPPWSAHDSSSVRTQPRGERAPWPQPTRQPADLVAIIDKCLSYDAEARYPDADALSRDLERHMNHYPVEARRASLWWRWRLYVRRHPVATFCALLLTMIGLAVLRYYDSRERFLREVHDHVLLRRDVAALRSDADQLWPLTQVSAGAIEAWLSEADKVVLRRQRAEVFLENNPSITARERAFIAQGIQAVREFEECPVSALLASGPARDAFSWWGSAIPEMRNRMMAARLTQRADGGIDTAWRLAIASIANPDECPAYKGLMTQPLPGLRPLARNPTTKLWEFWHVATGMPPISRSDGAGFAVLRDTAMVFVLLPGGVANLGAAADDDMRRKDEPASSEVRLAPFLCSKYEMTQGQWATVTRKQPSFLKGTRDLHVYKELGAKPDLRHPVEFITREECVDTLRRLQMDLPTEHEWEYAARAGTGWRWYTGDEELSLSLPTPWENLAGQELVSVHKWTPHFVPWTDSYVFHAPVDAFPANPWGLHCMLGNVSEICQDAELVLTRIRGGSWATGADMARASSRNVTPGPADDLGVRPVIRLVE